MITDVMNTRNKALSRAARLVLTAGMAAGLAACAPGFKADVSRFATSLPAPQGQTFAVVADDPALAGGLEFSLYSDYVAAELAELGYVETENPEAANLLVRFDYGVDNGRERVRTTGYGRDPFFDPWGRFGGFGYRRAYAFGFYDPFLAGPEVRSYTVYTSDIDLKIDNTTTGERLFEGQAQAVSRTNRLQVLVPNLVDAIFTDFPGRSGETLRITIREDGKSVRPID
ncbi:DUF4136 domain-containing protein [Qipengyuania nanhaisediminis]|uniref:DUF4136 domain-containing protein n=1 Tax=Qipengyuania nanhaisediminis TaxID=604088 RepID=UPI0038B281F1